MRKKRTYSDRAEYLKMAVKIRRHRVKLQALKYKSGKCIFCGYEKHQGALEFHHLDASKKDFGISYKGHARSWDKMKKELDKCILVCANCHREVHAGVTQLSSVMKIEKRGELLEA